MKNQKLGHDNFRFIKAAHAVQTGVEFDHNSGSNDGSPKHLRTGLNVCMCDHAALVRLLIEKGILTEEEYIKNIADEMEREKARYEAHLSEKLNMKVTLG